VETTVVSVVARAGEMAAMAVVMVVAAAEATAAEATAEGKGRRCSRSGTRHWVALQYTAGRAPLVLR